MSDVFSRPDVANDRMRRCGIVTRSSAPFPFFFQRDSGGHRPLRNPLSETPGGTAFQFTPPEQLLLVYHISSDHSSIVFYIPVHIWGKLGRQHSSCSWECGRPAGHRARAGTMPTLPGVPVPLSVNSYSSMTLIRCYYTGISLLLDQFQADRVLNGS